LCANLVSRGCAGWKMADILRMIVGEDETFVTLGLKRDGEAFSTSIKRSAKPMLSGHTPVLASPLHECHLAVHRGPLAFNLRPWRSLSTHTPVTRHCTPAPGRCDCFQATVTIRDRHAHIVDPRRCAQFPPRCLCVQRHGLAAPVLSVRVLSESVLRVLGAAHLGHKFTARCNV
jgi:hypothetical protein